MNLGDTYHNPSKWTYKDGAQTISNGNNRDLATGKRIEDCGLPPKTLCGVPERFALRMTDELGFCRRNTVIWHKPSVMPASVRDRFTIDFEYLYFFTKSPQYYFEQQFEPLKMESLRRARRGNSGGKWYDEKPLPFGIHNPTMSLPRDYKGYDGIEEEMQNSKGRNKRCVWSLTTSKLKEAHFATFPESLVETPISAGCPVGGIVCDPFMGSGTSAVVALKNNRNFIGIELQEKYIEIANKRLKPFLDQKKIENFGEKT